MSREIRHTARALLAFVLAVAGTFGQAVAKLPGMQLKPAQMI